MKSKLTAEDIAALSGVSRATVFAVLGGKNGVSAKTRQRVLETVEKHGYESGLIPKALAASVSKMVGVVLGSVKNPFWADVFSGIESVLSPEAFHQVLYHGTDDSYAGGLQEFETGRLLPLRAYIIYGGIRACRERFASFFDLVARDNLPLITINPGPADRTEGHTVWFDTRRASRDATEYLVAQGHERIACLTGPITSPTAHDRYLGYIEGLLANQIEAADNMMARAGETSSTGYGAALEMLSRPGPRPTAVVCYNDLCAIGVYRACHELGLRIPDDLSVVGCDGTSLAEVTGPPLTTISLFPEKTGQAAGQLLLEVVRGGHEGKPAHRLVEHALVPRSSVRAL